MTRVLRGPSGVVLPVALLASVAMGSGCVAEIRGLEGDQEDRVEAQQQSAELSAIVPEKELFVTDVSVVNDAKFVNYRPGKWNTDKEGGFSFGRLIDNLSTVEKPSNAQRTRFVMNWLKTWETPQPVAGQIIPARPKIRDVILTPWKLGSIGKNGNTPSTCTADPATDATCMLSFDVSVLPFRLLGVAYRPDLRLTPDPGSASTGSAGQGRFLFGALGADRRPLQFTIIFEYIIPVSGKSDIKSVAEKYHKLGTQAWGKDFNEKLHERTLDFTQWNRASSRPNGSALSQLRTNEVALAEAGSDPTSPFGLMWELREFVIGSSGELVPEPVKKEPAIHWNGTVELGAWAVFNQAAILAGTYDVPLELNGLPFSAASSFTPVRFGWTVPGVDEPVRRALALNTCNGCHRSETATSFLHVKNRLPDQAAVLSPFLQAELAPGGVRVADFTKVLTEDPSKIVKGPGKDGDDSDDND